MVLEIIRKSLTKVPVVPKPGGVSVCKMAAIVLIGSHQKMIGLRMKLVRVCVCVCFEGQKRA